MRRWWNTMKSKAINWLNAKINDDTPKSELDIIDFCKKAVKNYQEKEKTKSKQFEPPTLEQIQEHVKLKKYNVDVRKFYDYYQESEWHDARGKPVKNWKLKLMVWDRPKSTYKSANDKVYPKNREYSADELNSFFDNLEDVEL